MKDEIKRMPSLEGCRLHRESITLADRPWTPMRSKSSVETRRIVFKDQEQ